MNKLLIVLLAGLGTCCISSNAKINEYDDSQRVTVVNQPRFVTCENCSGAGFFWVDTSSGSVWWANIADSEWVYYGFPKGSKTGKGDDVGRYIPYENKNGKGLFILDTVSGLGWWTDGKQWKSMGLPSQKPSNQRIEPIVPSATKIMSERNNKVVQTPMDPVEAQGTQAHA